MSCKECERIQENNQIAYLRIGNANVGLLGCDEHINRIRNGVFNKDFTGQVIHRVDNV
jgi:hypothetical protein